MSIHDIRTTMHEPVTAYKIEGIKSKWLGHYFTPGIRIMNMTCGDKGLMERAPHVDPILRSLYVFGIKIEIPAPFARILELAGGGNQMATTMVFLNTMSRNSHRIDHDQEYVVTPFDWMDAWSLGPPVYFEDIPYTRGLNDTIDTEIMHELLEYPGEYISFLDYSWYWKAKIMNKPYDYMRDMMLQSLKTLGPHSLNTYHRIGPGNYKLSGKVISAVIPKLKEEVDKK